MYVEGWNGGSDSEFIKPNIWAVLPKGGEIDLHDCLLLRLKYIYHA